MELKVLYEISSSFCKSIPKVRRGELTDEKAVWFNKNNKHVTKPGYRMDMKLYCEEYLELMENIRGNKFDKKSKGTGNRQS